MQKRVLRNRKVILSAAFIDELQIQYKYNIHVQDCSQCMLYMLIIALLIIRSLKSMTDLRITATRKLMVTVMGHMKTVTHSGKFKVPLSRTQRVIEQLLAL